MGCGSSRAVGDSSRESSEAAELRRTSDLMDKLVDEEEAAALARFANSAWTTDAVESLKTLLSTPSGLMSFESFLKTEYSVSCVAMLGIACHVRSAVLAFCTRGAPSSRVGPP